MSVIDLAYSTVVGEGTVCEFDSEPSSLFHFSFPFLFDCSFEGNPGRRNAHELFEFYLVAIFQV